MDRRRGRARTGHGAARHRFLIVFLLAAACSSSPKNEGPPIGVDLELLNSPSGMLYFAGPVNLQFQATLSNPTDQAVTLQRLDLRTLGGGSFVMRATGTAFHVTVPPHGTKTVTMSAWGTSRGGMLAEDEPIQLQATAYFSGPQGSFVRLLNTRLSPR